MGNSAKKLSLMSPGTGKKPQKKPSLRETSSRPKRKSLFDTVKEFAGRKSKAGDDEKSSGKMRWISERKMEFTQQNTVVSEEVKNGFNKFFEEFACRISLKLSESENTPRDMSRQQFITMMKQFLGEDLDIDLTLKLFDYMDCDKNNRVDEVEFSVVTVFLFSKSVGTAYFELAFNLFDSNKDGSISQQEMGEMLSVVIGGTVQDLVNIPQFRSVFEKFVEQTLAAENLEFYYEMLPYVESKSEREVFVPMKKVDFIVDTFFGMDKLTAINVSGKDKSEVIRLVEMAKERGADGVSVEVFKTCFMEVQYMLTEHLQKFKSSLRSPPYSDLILDVWARFEKEEDEGLTIKEFQEFVEDIPTLFDAMNKIQTEFEDLVHQFLK